MEITHFSHKHSLALSDLIDGEACCSGCSQPITGPAYVCAVCKFYIHKSCSELPQQMRHPFHPPHDLTLLSEEHNCRVCSESCKGLTFYCTICDFALDVTCAMLMPTISNEHLERQIQHYSHPHSLIPFDPKTRLLICCGCDGILGDSTYACPECLFFLCKSCVETPEIIKHPFHPQHQLTFLPDSPDGIPVFCNACCEMHFGLVYHCATCQFYLGLKCASLPTVKYEGHDKHPLAFMNKDSDFKCHECRTFCRRSFLRCVLCDLNLHVKCIPALPRAVKVSKHKHRLTLTDSLPEDGSDKYYCFYCEDERNPKYSVYYCAECELASHIKCGLSELLLSSEEESSTMEESMVLRQLVDAGFDAFNYYSSDEPADTTDGVMFYTITLKQLMGKTGNFSDFFDALKEK